MSTLWAFITRQSVELKQKIHAWWWFLPAVSLALLFKAYSAWLLAALLLALGVRELAAHMHFASPESARWRHVLGIALCVVLVALTFLWPAVALALIALAVGLIWQMFRRRFDPPARGRVGGSALVLMACGLSFLPTLQRALSDEGAWLLWVCAVTALADVGQFVAGTVFGKTKIAPAASPGKTWAGLVGGIGVAMLAGIALGGLMHLADIPVLARLSVLIAVAGFLGDITLSACKRMLAIKDFSAWMPGHGGLLDRVDSLILTVPVLYLCLLPLQSLFPVIRP